MEKNTQYQPEYNEKFRFSSEKEQQLSAEWSSLVNKAYKILLSPIQRAEYLLKSQNVQVPEGNKSSNAEFLMEMLERNEEVRLNNKYYGLKSPKNPNIFQKSKFFNEFHLFVDQFRGSFRCSFNGWFRGSFRGSFRCSFHGSFRGQFIEKFLDLCLGLCLTKSCLRKFLGLSRPLTNVQFLLKFYFSIYFTIILTQYSQVDDQCLLNS